MGIASRARSLSSVARPTVRLPSERLLPPISTDFVPSQPSDFRALPHLAELLSQHRCAVLTGAGCSTASGIPDYRGPQTSKRERSPILYQTFVNSEDARRRYWARSAIGWPRIAGVKPNLAHRSLAALESRDLLSGLITQNVDSLHLHAGHQQVIELHGTLDEVICLDCRTTCSRTRIQHQIQDLNPGWTNHHAQIAPDGDVAIPDIPRSFTIPDCPHCSGILKPNVVFFGENVAAPTLERAWRVLDDASMLLIVGSSLTVYSGYRFLKRACAQHKPVVLLNLGNTRGDEEADLKIEAQAGPALQRLLQLL